MVFVAYTTGLFFKGTMHSLKSKVMFKKYNGFCTVWIRIIRAFYYYCMYSKLTLYTNNVLLLNIIIFIKK